MDMISTRNNDTRLYEIIDYEFDSNEEMTPKISDSAAVIKRDFNNLEDENKAKNSSMRNFDLVPLVTIGNFIRIAMYSYVQ